MNRCSKRTRIADNVNMLGGTKGAGVPDENPTVPIQVIARLPLARDAKEDWSGLKDATKRRKLQNRLHQRAWRMHIAYCHVSAAQG